MDCQASVSIIINGKSILLIKRQINLNDPWSGHMALPGGHRLNHETCEQAAVRETYEEVGLKIKIIDFLGIYVPGNRTDLNVAAFIARPLTLNIKIDNEVSECFWASYNDLKELGNTYIIKNHVVFGMTYRILKDFFMNKYHIYD
ncbi:NUDIX hydrolase [Picrophilus oshimae]|uniref:Phosphohydrolase n=1 Tax=Picrophilus torridus (strain ATCC 700027 / DSM 9790 / JCM 10055 / NBRC 100828 / KAW 2/3) TaxID=1122961 RepID=Q6L0W7_PICTO|nr:NUDIX hydrolase [Picrophilus oshimae]AAT43385.1 phosphohydrolase [Picrophilus oshimae DSM 9789]